MNVLQFTLPISAADDSICLGADAQLTANGSGTITWYSDAALTQILGTGTAVTIGQPTSTMVYFVTQQEGGCMSDPVQITVEVAAAPVDVTPLARPSPDRAVEMGPEVGQLDTLEVIRADVGVVVEELEPVLADHLLAADPGASGAFCYAGQFISPDLTAAERAQLSVDETPMPGLIPSALLARRDVLDRVGPFDTSLAVGEFIDWHERARALGLRFVTLDDVLVRRRVHATNMGRRNADSRADYLRVIKSALDRRRAGVG